MHVREHPRFGSYYRVVERRPSWVVRAAVACAVVVFIVPVVMLVLAAAAVGLVVFFVLGFVASVWHTISAVFGGKSKTHGRDVDAGPTPDGGRENVRIIR